VGRSQAILPYPILPDPSPPEGVQLLLKSLETPATLAFPAHIFGYLPGTTSPMTYGVAPQGYGAARVVALFWIVAGFAIFAPAT
jgi:hypothetical protein